MKQPENKIDAVEAETLNILESLLDSIHKTQSFKGKWSLMEAKLSDLKSQLSSLPSHSLSLSLLHSLSLTLSEALTLSLTCHTPNLPSGKLKTQNDVDSISAKLDNHIRDSNILIKSGVLHHHHHDVVSSVRNLVTRLQIGSVESRTFALDSLLNLIHENEKNVVIVVAQGVVPVLVRLLDSGFSGEVREKTVTAIARVSITESTKHALLAEGFLLLHNLIRVLESGTGLAKEKACIVLEALTHSKENAIVICSRGGFSSLLQICHSGTPSSQAFAAGVLRNLTGFSHTIDDFVEGNGVSVLLTLASSGTALAQEHSIACLSNVVREDDDMKLLIVRKGGIDCLKSFWDSTPVVRSLEVAVEFLSNLASDRRLVEVIISNGFLNRLISVLNCGVLGVRIYAAEAIYKLGYNAKTQKELGELGFIPVLVRMLDGKAMKEIEAAAKALSTILIYTENRRIYRKEEKGIVNVVHLLDPLIKNVDKKYPISILMSLSHSTKCRKEMVNSGALLHLPKLVTMEVEGAKKLEEMIGGGKLWGVFKRH